MRNITVFMSSTNSQINDLSFSTWSWFLTEFISLFTIFFFLLSCGDAGYRTFLVYFLFLSWGAAGYRIFLVCFCSFLWSWFLLLSSRRWFWSESTVVLLLFTRCLGWYRQSSVSHHFCRWLVLVSGTSPVVWQSRRGHQIMSGIALRFWQWLLPGHYW